MLRSQSLECSCLVVNVTVGAIDYMAYSKKRNGLLFKKVKYSGLDS